MKDKFIKNGVFSLEYDKETLRDMVLELQEENEKLKADISNLLDIINKNCNELKCTYNEWLVIQKYQDKEVE